METTPPARTCPVCNSTCHSHGLWFECNNPSCRTEFRINLDGTKHLIKFKGWVPHMDDKERGRE